MADSRPITAFKFTQEEYDLYLSGIEIWRDIEGWKDYQISTNGRMKSFSRLVWGGKGYYTTKDKIMKTPVAGRGYPMVGLSVEKLKKHFTIHYLVGSTFLSNPLNKKEFNHMDTIKTHSYLSNLEYSTRHDNLKHAYDNNLRTAPMSMFGKFGKDHHSSKPIIQYDLHGNFIARFNGGYEAGRETGTNKGNLAACALGIVKTAGGFKWKYECDLVPLP